MSSTAGEGRFSRIVPMLELGTTVTISRTDKHEVVMEYGAVNLRGQSLRRRAEALVSIAHPDFREKLARACRKQFGRK